MKRKEVERQRGEIEKNVGEDRSSFSYLLTEKNGHSEFLRVTRDWSLTLVRSRPALDQSECVSVCMSNATKNISFLLFHFSGLALICKVKGTPGRQVFKGAYYYVYFPIML